MSELPAVALLGFALAASPGPVNALAFARGLREGAMHALLLVLGADTADLLYATLVLLGAGPFVNRPATQAILSLGGGIFLTYLGIGNLRSARSQGFGEMKDAVVSSGRLAAYGQGLTIALFSPLTIVFWMSVFGGYYAETTARGSRIPPVLLLAVLMLGAGLWTIVSLVMIHFGRKTLSGRVYSVLVTVLSIVLLVFAARLLWTGVHAVGALGQALPDGKPHP